jgi:hypothetical protein
VLLPLQQHSICHLLHCCCSRSSAVAATAVALLPLKLPLLLRKARKQSQKDRPTPLRSAWVLQLLPQRCPSCCSSCCCCTDPAAAQQTVSEPHQHSHDIKAKYKQQTDSPSSSMRELIAIHTSAPSRWKWLSPCSTHQPSTLRQTRKGLHAKQWAETHAIKASAACPELLSHVDGAETIKGRTHTHVLTHTNRCKKKKCVTR